MFKKMIEEQTGKLSDEEFEWLLDIVNDDVKFHYCFFNKKVKLENILEVAKNAVHLVRSTCKL